MVKITYNDKRTKIFDSIYDICNENMLDVIEVDFGYNNLTKISPKIGKLSNLYYLNLSYNKLIELPTEIYNLTNLKILNIGNNKIKKISTDICKLINLTEFYCNENELTDLPIGNLINLQVCLE